MSAPPLVRRARDDETEAVASVLTDAFADEDGLNYWLRQRIGQNPRSTPLL